MSLAVFVSLLGCRGRTPGSGPSVVIQGETLTIGGTRMQFGAPLAEWKRVLGEPSRWVDRAGGVAVWDDAGLFVVMQAAFVKDDPHVAAIWFAMVPREGDMWPAHPFAGRLELDGKALTGASSTRFLVWPFDDPLKVYEHHAWEGCSYYVGRRATRDDSHTLEAVFVTSECPENRPAFEAGDPVSR